MLKILSTALLGTLLFLGAPIPARAEQIAFKTLFCPECWTYLGGGGALDLQGNCAQCGKYPVELETRRMSWWWCAKENRWSEAPADDPKGSSAPEESLAVVVPRSETLGVWYCPRDQSFQVCRLPLIQQVICATCARPAVRTFGSERAWTWCESDGLWTPAPNPPNPGKGCGVRRSGILLAYPDPGPIAY
jgi:hypothetical protein